MTVAYLIHTHAKSDQVLRLVRTIKASSPGSLVVVDHAQPGEPLDVQALTALPGVHYRVGDAGYGDWSFLQRWLDSVAYLADNSLHYDWLVTLSGQDYPLVPLPRAEAELADSGADAFIEHFPVLSPQESHWPVHRGRSRYWFKHRRLARLSARQQRRLHWLQAVNFVQPLVRIHVSFGLSFGRRVRTPFTEELQCYGGSAWTTLTRACVDYVVEFCRRRPDVERHYRGVIAPDESFLHTVLVNANRFLLVDDSKRYFDFRGSEFNHPKVLGVADLPAALSSGAHFGRKFDMDRDSTVLDELDRIVLGQRI